MVKLASGTLPHASAHRPAPRRAATSCVGVRRRFRVVPELGGPQDVARGRRGRRARAAAPATARAAGRLRPWMPAWAHACANAASQARGVLFAAGRRRRGMRRPGPRRPRRRCRRRAPGPCTADVDESTPTTRGTSAPRAAAPSRVGRAARGRSPVRRARPRRRCPRGARRARRRASWLSARPVDLGHPQGLLDLGVLVEAAGLVRQDQVGAHAARGRSPRRRRRPRSGTGARRSAACRPSAASSSSFTT